MFYQVFACWRSFSFETGCYKITSNKILFTEYTHVNTIEHNRVSNFKLDVKSLILVSECGFRWVAFY